MIIWGGIFQLTPSTFAITIVNVASLRFPSKPSPCQYSIVFSRTKALFVSLSPLQYNVPFTFTKPSCPFLGQGSIHFHKALSKLMLHPLSWAPTSSCFVCFHKLSLNQYFMHYVKKLNIIPLFRVVSLLNTIKYIQVCRLHVTLSNSLTPITLTMLSASCKDSTPK